MSKYRRIEVNAFRHRVTVVSGEWPQDDGLLAQTDDAVLVNDTDLREPVAPDSPEGQLILVEAVRSLERRLSPEARATIFVGRDPPGPGHSDRNGLFSRLQSLLQFIHLHVLRFNRKEKSNAYFKSKEAGSPSR